jgi:glycosyltransferase involved in cell wall biosynthesis
MAAAGIDVAITTFRRPEMVVAAVRSCLAQGEWLSRVVVVDDASGDDTPVRLAALGDDRVVVHVRSSNGGIGAARRDAMERCSAEWTVLIDSDHELLLGALREFATAARAADPRVGILGARYLWDTGAVKPVHLPSRPIGYEDRIRWSARPGSIGCDYVACFSRRVRERVKWSPVRSGMVDALFQLDAARIAHAQFLAKCLAYQKSDGPEGHSRGTVEHLLARRRSDAPGGIVLCQEILDRHGPALLRHGRPLLASTLKNGAICAALVGRRALAARWALEAVAVGGPAQVTPGLVPACLAGGALFAWAFRRSLVRGGAVP